MTALATALRLASHQDGVLSARQAVALGLTRSALINLVQRHGWRRPLHGVFLVPEFVISADRARARALMLRAPDAVISHRSAARLWELEGVPRRSPTEPIHATLTDRRLSRHQRPGVQFSWRALSDSHIVDLDGIRVTTPERTLVDLAATETREVSVCAAESSIRRNLLSLDQVRALPTATPGDVWSLVDPLAESPIETLIRLPLIDAEIGPLVSQYEVLIDGIVVARTDLALPEQAIAIEGDGSDAHDNSRAFVQDRRRDALLAGLDWFTLRFTWADAARPAYVVQTVSRTVEQRRHRRVIAVSSPADPIDAAATHTEKPRQGGPMKQQRRRQSVVKMS